MRGETDSLNEKVGSALDNNGNGCRGRKDSRVGCRRMRSDVGTGPAREHLSGLGVPSKKEKKIEAVRRQTL